MYRVLTFHVPKKKSFFLLRDTSLRNTPHRISEWGSSLPPYCFVSRGSISPCEYFLTMFFHGEALLAPHPTPKLEDHPSSAVRDCLFNIIAATLHIGGRFSIHNLRTSRAVVKGTHLSREILRYLKDDINIRNANNNNSALHLAADSSSVDIIKLLLAERMYVNLTNTDDNTPLHVSAEFGHLEATKTLVIFVFL